MAVYVTLSEEQLREICSFYDLGDFVSFAPISTGTVNSNFFLTTTRNRFFLRVYEEKALVRVRYERALTNFMRFGGFPVPASLGNSAVIFMCEDKLVGVFDALEGEMLCQQRVTPEVCARVGSLLARMHEHGKSFAVRKQSSFGFEPLRGKLDGLVSNAHQEIREVVPYLKQKLSVAAKSIEALPFDGVIHADLFRDNVLWVNESISGVIDWESASDGWHGYDLMVTLWAWCFADELKVDLARSLVGAYLKENAPLAAQKELLHGFATLAAVRFTTTRILDCFLRESVGDRVYRDYKRFLKRLETVSAYSSPEWTQCLGI